MSAAAGGGVLSGALRVTCTDSPASGGVTTAIQAAVRELPAGTYWIVTDEALAAVAELIATDKEYDAAKEAARGFIFIEGGYESDSYGVYGSDFYRCRACDAESGAGVLNRGVSHDQDCVVGRYEKAEAHRSAALSNIEGGQ